MKGKADPETLNEPNLEKPAAGTEKRRREELVNGVGKLT